MNRYAYANNAPLNFFDPFGLFNIIVGAGGSAVAPTGVEGSGGIVVNPGLGDQQADIGVFGSIGAGGGVNVSGDVFIGVIKGDIGNVSGTTVNINVGLGPISATIITNPTTGEIIGGTIGFGPSATPISGSGTLSSTGTFTLRDLAGLIFGEDGDGSGNAGGNSGGAVSGNRGSNDSIGGRK